VSAGLAKATPSDLPDTANSKAKNLGAEAKVTTLSKASSTTGLTTKLTINKK
jgi:hypothetical protein